MTAPQHVAVDGAALREQEKLENYFGFF